MFIVAQFIENASEMKGKNPAGKTERRGFASDNMKMPPS
jgi:hypothetical protein